MDSITAIRLFTGTVLDTQQQHMEPQRLENLLTVLTYCARSGFGRQGLASDLTLHSNSSVNTNTAEHLAEPFRRKRHSVGPSRC